MGMETNNANVFKQHFNILISKTGCVPGFVKAGGGGGKSPSFNAQALAVFSKHLGIRF